MGLELITFITVLYSLNNEFSLQLGYSKSYHTAIITSNASAFFALPTLGRNILVHPEKVVGIIFSLDFY